MLNLFDAENTLYTKQPNKALKIINTGTTKIKDTKVTTLAAFASVAMALMNTDEFLTRK